ncbi:Golgi transport complex subunit 4 [Blastocladiella emersonii ATCC 22665]|nr:Golgi transport complex subunit 4 [Blastocladiella emersonii ATCC 22665]
MTAEPHPPPRTSRTRRRSIVQVRPEALTGLDDVQAALAALSAAETDLVAELEGMAAAPRRTPEDLLWDKSDVIDKLATQADSFLRIASESDAISASLGSTLKGLDLELRHLDKAIDRIHLLVDVKGCTTNVQAAMQKADWETAAGYVERHLQRVRELGTPPPASQQPPTSPLAHRPSISDLDPLPTSLQTLFPHQSTIEDDMRRAEAILDLTRKELKDAISTEFRRAAADPSSPDAPAILRCFALFPRIGEHELGVTLFVDYVAQVLAARCADAARELHTMGSGANVQLLTKVLENIVALINQNAPLVGDTYGAGFPIYLVQRLYRESIAQCAPLIDGWQEKRRLAQMLTMARQNVDIGARELDAALSELVVLLQRSELYHRVLRHRAAQIVAQARATSGADATLTALLARIDADRALSPDTGLPLLGDLERTTKELSNHYIALEEVYLRSNARRAMELDTPHGGAGGGPLLSSCVDDVFFLLKKSVGRALATRDLDVACHLLQDFESVVNQDFAAVLHAKLDAQFEAFAADPKPDVRGALMMQLNNLQQLVTYMPKFLDDVERNIQLLVDPAASHPGQQPSSPTSDTPPPDPKALQALAKRREKVAFSLAPFNRLAHAMAHVVQDKLAAMFNTFLKAKVTALLRYLHTAYTMDEDEYLALSSANQFIGNNFRFTGVFGNLLANSKSELLGANLSALLLIMVSHWLAEWEKLVLAQRFSQFGALYLERDIRSFAAYVTAEASAATGTSSAGGADDGATGASGEAGASLTWSHALREKLAGIHQLVALLTLSEPREVFDYWGPKAIAPMPRKLSATQVRAVLLQRVDFAADEVNRLKL